MSTVRLAYSYYAFAKKDKKKKQKWNSACMELTIEYQITESPFIAHQWFYSEGKHYMLRALHVMSSNEAFQYMAQELEYFFLFIFFDIWSASLGCYHLSLLFLNKEATTFYYCIINDLFIHIYALSLFFLFLSDTYQPTFWSSILFFACGSATIGIFTL